MEHKNWHWGCCILPIISLVFWVASIVFTIAAWMSVVKNALVWGYGAQWWIINALIFGLLALYGRSKHGCAHCMVQKGHEHHEM